MGSDPLLLLKMFCSCLVAGVFLSRWKKAKLPLIPKGKKLPVGVQASLYAGYSGKAQRDVAET